MAIPILQPTQHWYCPNCTLAQVTHEARPHTRFHACPGTRGLVIGMLPFGTKATVTVVEREDYVGSEQVQLDPERRRPVMAVKTAHADGRQDVVVYAPTATGRT